MNWMAHEYFIGAGYIFLFRNEEEGRKEEDEQSGELT